MKSVKRVKRTEKQAPAHVIRKDIIPKKWNGPVVVLIIVIMFGGAFILTPKPMVDLAKFETAVFSQNGEDGVIEKIFSLIKPTSYYAVEFGAGDGVKFSNVRHLIVNKGWSSFMIEGDDELAQKCSESYRDYPKARCLQAWVYPGNIEILFEEDNVPKDLDLLVIDIDSNDYYVWKAIHDYRPKVVQIEYNGIFAPPQKVVVDFHPMNYWDEKTFYYGASIQSYYELAKKKGYELVYAESRGINLFFVDKKYFNRFGIKDNSPAKIYRPHHYFRNLPPTVFTEANINMILNEDGTLKPPADKDLTWNKLRIKKKFILGR